MESAKKKSGRRGSRHLWAYILGLVLVLASASVSVLYFGDELVSIISELFITEPAEPVSPGDAPPPEKPQGWQGWQKAVISGGAELLSSPNGELMTLLDDGTELMVMGLENGWYHCRWGTKTGWVTAGSTLLLEGEPTKVEEAEIPEPVALSGRDKEEIDAIFEKYRALAGSVAIIKNGRVTGYSSYGVIDLKDEVPCDENTKFRVASVTKLVVAMTAMAMDDQGILSIDDDINLYLNKPIKNPYARGYAISFRNLLTHTGTVGNFRTSGVGSDVMTYRLAESGSWCAAIPGEATAWSYSNNGIGVCGSAMEFAAGMTLADYTGSYFFEPLGIDASFTASKVKNRGQIAPCYEYRKVSRSVESMVNWPYSEEPGENHNYAGALVISSMDLAKLLCVLINDGYYDGVYYMSPQTVAEMETVQYSHPKDRDFDQCVGVRYREDLIAGRDLYYHPGLVYGIYSLVSYDKATGDGVVVITNGAMNVTTNAANVSNICEAVSQYCYENLCS